MWISGRWHWLVKLLIILMIVMFVTNVFREWGFPWWMFFFVWPVFGSWSRESRRDPREKRKRDYDTYEDEAVYEKPKREPRYALGDDGELIELPADEEEAKPKRHDYV